MSAKMIAFDQEAHEAVKRGVNTLAKAVRTTLGPCGRNVIFEKSFGSPTVTKDGVTVAREIELECKYENIGARLVREVASKTNDVAGDGTTTATVLADAIYSEGLKAVVAGVNPIELKAGIERAVADVVANLQKRAIPVKGRKDMEAVATIAGNNDPKVGKIIAEAMTKVGKQGVATIDEGKSMETELDFVEGMQFDKGFQSPYFVTNSDAMTAELEDAYILIYEKKISQVRSFVPLLEKVSKAGKPLLIICEEVEGEALATLVINRMRGNFKVCAVKSPGFGDRRKAMMEDIAILTGGDAIMESLGLKLEALELSHLGRAKKVIVDKDNTTIIGGAGKKDTITGRIAQIDAELEKSTSDYDKEKLSERKAKLSGGVAKINVGGVTEAQVKERKYLYEDALNATRAAMEEGVLPGGGVALLRASSEAKAKGLTHDETVGYDIVRRACRSPLIWIANNAGQDGTVICDKVLQGKDNFGYNALTGEYVDMVDAGVIDPAKVVRSGLQNASSVATLLLTSDALIADLESGDHNHKK